MTGTCRSVCTHGEGVVSLKWHNSLPLIATAALDNFVRLWDARDGTLIFEFSGHCDLVLNLAMAPLASGDIDVSDVIVSVSDDGTAKIFQFNAAAVLS